MATRRAPIRSSSRSVKRTDRSGRNEPRTARWLSAALGMIGCILIAQPALSQYFGQNKVQYESFDFKVLRTDHFDVYFYPEERASAELAGRMAERWYARLSRYLGHELSGRQPLLLYASHPDFEQTNALSGVLGEGTGGVTEALKRRIVLPLAGPLAETDHVIGHELVHAFQYDITGEGRSVATDSPVLTRLPLWFVEGMAEYASIGPRDPQTAMWMRDATARDDLPDLGKLASNRYFPYRYGQAFLSFVAGTFGDDAIGRILQAPGRHGTIELGMKEALGADPDSVVKAWHRALHGQFDPWRDRLHPATDYGARILGEPETGRLQVGPVVSPDGRKMLLFSERDRFAINLFVIDVKTGDVLRRLSRNEVDPHFESLLFIRSAGSWAPDSRRVVFPAITRGRPELVIMDTETGERLREIRFSELGEIYDPAWSPDGRTIAFSALASGMTDLFVYDLQEDRLERWTDD
ncbi:MAG: PD40 domain-containing protein, partial [Candidatus Eisenbacteria bacterium]|nr:PD40 domain-containing protein [Candidatus Eisenbacteria bacterium]